MQSIARSFIFQTMDSPFHRLDPRARLLISVELFTLALVSHTVLQIATVLVAALALAGVSRIIHRLSRTLVYTMIFSSAIFLLNLFAGYFWTDALVLAVRFVAIVSSTSLFFLTTSPDELEHVMKWIRLPRDVVFAFVTAVRFVPVLMLDALQIMDAQKSRGLELERGGFRKRIRNFVPVLIPLVVTAVIRSGELAEAMESRAYGAVKRPTSLHSLRLRRTDVLASIMGLLLSTFGGISFYYNLFG